MDLCLRFVSFVWLCASPFTCGYHMYVLVACFSCSKSSNCFIHFINETCPIILHFLQLGHFKGLDQRAFFCPSLFQQHFSQSSYLTFLLSRYTMLLIRSIFITEYHLFRYSSQLFRDLDLLFSFSIFQLLFHISSYFPLLSLHNLGFSLVFRIMVLQVYLLSRLRFINLFLLSLNLHSFIFNKIKEVQIFYMLFHHQLY